MVNLYPFYQKVTSAGGSNFDDGIENIDIGGPAMIRAAAKVTMCPCHNHQIVRISTEIICWQKVIALKSVFGGYKFYCIDAHIHGKTFF